jgi:hypothetical protein
MGWEKWIDLVHLGLRCKHQRGTALGARGPVKQRSMTLSERHFY